MGDQFDPFAEDALILYDVRAARITATMARMAAIQLDDVHAFPNRRAIVAHSQAANNFAHEDTFLVPLGDGVDGAGLPICNVTVQSLATTNSFAILVVKNPPTLTSGVLTLVATSPAGAIDQAINFLGPIGSTIHFDLDANVDQMLEAGPTVKRIANEELRRIEGNLNPPIHQPVGLGGPAVEIAAAISNATISAADKRRHQEIAVNIESFDNMALFNAFYSPSHEGPDRAPPQAVQISAAKKTMVSAFNNASRNRISMASFMFSDTQQESLAMGRFGRGPGQISVQDITREDDKQPLTVTKVERCLRDLAAAWEVTHGPIAASTMRTMGSAVREAMELEESQGTELAKVIDYYLNIYHRIPAVLPPGITRAQHVTQEYQITHQTAAVVEFKASLVQKALKDNKEAMEKIAEQAKAFKVSPSPTFSHGSPVRVGKPKTAVSPAATKSAEKPFVPATVEAIAEWKTRRPAFLAPDEKVMCKKTATTGQPCNRAFCKHNDAYKAPDEAKQQQVVEWVKNSPFTLRKK